MNLARQHTCWLVVLATAVCLLFASPALAEQAATRAPGAAAPKAEAKAKKQDLSDAEQRAASSEFEREKLDSSAFEEEEQKAAEAKDTEKSESGGAGAIMRMIFGLVVVLGAIYVVHWMLKKWGQARMNGTTGSSGIIDVVATTPLAQNRALHLIRVGNEMVLIGATEQSINQISTVNASEVNALLSGGGEFGSMLHGALGGSQPAPGEAAGPTNTMQRIISNLQIMTAR